MQVMCPRLLGLERAELDSPQCYLAPQAGFPGQCLLLSASGCCLARDHYLLLGPSFPSRKMKETYQKGLPGLADSEKPGPDVGMVLPSPHPLSPLRQGQL